MLALIRKHTDWLPSPRLHYLIFSLHDARHLPLRSARVSLLSSTILAIGSWLHLSRVSMSMSCYPSFIHNSTAFLYDARYLLHAMLAIYHALPCFLPQYSPLAPCSVHVSLLSFTMLAIGSMLCSRFTTFLHHARLYQLFLPRLALPPLQLFLSRLTLPLYFLSSAQAS